MSVPLVRSLLSGQERFAVTGASGWLGRTTLELLAGALGPERFRDQVAGFASTSRTVTLRDATVVHLEPLDLLAHLVPAPTHILHFAYLTRDRVADLGVPDYIRTNLAITAAVVGAIERFHPRGVFVTSSGAVYEPDGTFATDAAANPYGTLKHLEELALRRAAADVGARSVVTRIFSLSGAYMTKPQLYALGDLILQALEGGPMIIRAHGPVERSYCAASDVIALALACLLRVDTGDDVVFDSSGEVTEISELAERVRGALGRSDITIERSWDPSAAPDRYVGDSQAMSAIAIEHGLSQQPIADQILDTAAYLGAQANRN